MRLARRRIELSSRSSNDTSLPTRSIDLLAPRLGVITPLRLLVGSQFTVFFVRYGTNLLILFGRASRLSTLVHKLEPCNSICYDTIIHERVRTHKHIISGLK